MMKILSKYINTNRKKREIWEGVVHKTQSSGDNSLDYLLSESKGNYTYLRYVATAAVLLVFFGVYLLISRSNNSEILHQEELAHIYSDPHSSSRLVLSTGDTLVLDSSNDLDSRLLAMQDDERVIDFRKLEDDRIEDELQLVETGRGKSTTFILSDGTRIWLNASSKIEFPAKFMSGERLVKVSGEAYFEVAHNVNKPFIVQFGDTEVKVLGTHFNIRNYEDQGVNSVTLLEGSVQVRDLQNTNRKAILKPSDQLLHSKGESFYIQQLADPYAVVAWKDDYFFFDNADANYIVQELERWYPVEISLSKYDKGKKISGKIKRSEAIKEVIDMLKFFDFSVEVTRN